MLLRLLKYDKIKLNQDLFFFHAEINGFRFVGFSGKPEPATLLEISGIRSMKRWGGTRIELATRSTRRGHVEGGEVH